jgi:hypothetical protein
MGETRRNRPSAICSEVAICIDLHQWEGPKRTLPAMFTAQPRFIRTVRFEIPKIPDRRRWARTTQQMAGRVSVSALAAVFPGKIDYRPQYDRRGRRMLFGERLGRRFRVAKGAAGSNLIRRWREVRRFGGPSALMINDTLWATAGSATAASSPSATAADQTVSNTSGG